MSRPRCSVSARRRATWTLGPISRVIRRYPPLAGKTGAKRLAEFTLGGARPACELVQQNELIRAAEKTEKDELRAVASLESNVGGLLAPEPSCLGAGQLGAFGKQAKAALQHSVRAGERQHRADGTAGGG
jgi:hypothetical protein